MSELNSELAETGKGLTSTIFNEWAYSVKLVSQAAELNDPNRIKEVITVKDDELFKDWSRIMIKYQGLVEEIQARLQ